MATPVWDTDVDALALAPLASAAAADVVVIGLGASGLAAVELLTERGCDVIGIDTGGVASGAAGRNGGLLLGGLAMFHHDAVAALGKDRAIGAYRATLDELDRITERWPDLVRRTGSLRLAASGDEAEDCDANLAALVDAGIAAERYDGPEGTGLLVVDDAAVQPRARCMAQARELLRRGARLHGGTRAIRVRAGSVETVEGAITADHVVVCVDGGLERLVPSLAGTVRSTRLQMLATAPATDVRLPRPVYRRWGFDYWQQLPDGRLAVGGGRDLHAEAEWGAPARPSAAVQKHLDHLVRDVIGTSATVTHRWAGTVAYTPSRLPVIEIVDTGVVAVGAYSGHGNLLGPMCARAAVELLLDGQSPLAELLSAPTLTA